MKIYDVFAPEATMPLTIRQALPADAAVVIEFNRLLAQESEGKTLDPAVLTPGVAAGLADPRKSVYFLAEEDGAPIGQIMYTTEWSDWRNGWFWWIQSVYVRREARRRGIFTALFEHVAAAAKADPQVIGLRLYVERENHVAQATYRRMGMEPGGYVVFERYPL
jgi:GNAT superfamily N-acetyltransferase